MTSEISKSHSPSITQLPQTSAPATEQPSISSQDQATSVTAARVFKQDKASSTMQASIGHLQENASSNEIKNGFLDGLKKILNAIKNFFSGLGKSNIHQVKKQAIMAPSKEKMEESQTVIISENKDNSAILRQLNEAAGKTETQKSSNYNASLPKDDPRVRQFENIKTIAANEGNAAEVLKGLAAYLEAKITITKDDDTGLFRQGISAAKAATFSDNVLKKLEENPKNIDMQPIFKADSMAASITFKRIVEEIKLAPPTIADQLLESLQSENPADAIKSQLEGLSEHQKDILKTSIKLFNTAIKSENTPWGGASMSPEQSLSIAITGNMGVDPNVVIFMMKNYDQIFS